MRAAALKSYLKQPRDVIHARLLVSSQKDADTLEFEVDIDLPQRPLHSILATEHVRVVFPPDDALPEVYALREDFPHVPHLVLNKTDYPRQLCLYQRTWIDERENWAPRPFIERIRHWFMATADGSLHLGDQPLESTIQGSPSCIVLPKYDCTPGKSCRLERYHLTQRPENYLIASHHGSEQSGPPVPVLFVQGPVVHHGIMHRSPATLAELEKLLNHLGGSITNSISEELSAARAELMPVAQRPLLLVLELPKRRYATGPIEAWEHQAFVIAGKTSDLLQEERIEVMKEGIIVFESRPLFLNPEKLATLNLVPLSVRWHLQPTFAAAMNGFTKVTTKIVAVGAGSFGSQVTNHLWRSGFGHWTLVDDDVCDAHNPARHVLNSDAVGFKKADALAQTLGAVYPEQPAPSWIDANYLAPKTKEPELIEALKAAEIILDFSASVPVGRHLANDKRTAARRMSAFLNLRGDESILLAEDAARHTDLAWLEAEYLRAVANTAELRDHFDDVRTVAHRYGNGCRDLSTVVAQDSLALHAGLMAASIRQASTIQNATISVRRWSRTSGEVKVVNVAVHSPCIVTVDNWQVRLHPEVLQRLRTLRTEKLPKETGGILLGLIDRTLHIVTVIDLLPAPPDSESWPTCFIRGSNGLKAAVDRTSKRTLGNVLYMGEWHSHPDCCSARPSALDFDAVAICAPHAHADGMPTLMLIAAADEFSVIINPPGQKKVLVKRIDF